MEKKSLLSTLKTTKKINVVTSGAKNEGATSRKIKMAKASVSAKRAVGLRLKKM